MSNAFDREGEASASPDLLGTLHKTLEEAVQLEGIVAQLESDLRAAKASLHAVTTNRIPDLMSELQLERLTYRGWKVKVVDFVNGSLPKGEAARAKAVAWLIDNDGASIIKTDVRVSFGRAQHADALGVAKRLVDDGFAPTVDSGVHASTLCAWARERIKSGEPLDIDTLGLFTGRTARFSQVKP